MPQGIAGAEAVVDGASRRRVADLKAHPLSQEIFDDLPPDRLADLKDDIAKNGLRHPLELDCFDRVICGSQRLKAIKLLGWQSVPVIVRAELADEDAIDEWLICDNTLRRQLSPDQMYRAGVALERIMVAQAARRSQSNLKYVDVEGDLGETGRVDEQIAKRLGISRSHYARLHKVYDSTDDELKEMVSSGRLSVSAAAQKLRETPHKAQMLEPDDAMAIPLRYLSWERRVNDFVTWLEKNPPSFSHLQPKAVDVLKKVRSVVVSYLD